MLSLSKSKEGLVYMYADTVQEFVGEASINTWKTWVPQSSCTWFKSPHHTSRWRYRIPTGMNLIQISL